ncbi:MULTISPECIES: MFS transporter [unclassified Nocardia]|uniref:MFS transporter n=1 Tax=unclassified Nocardia TaxID=2637762 RepID=UPI001CE468CE|nr:MULTISPECIES: MFS transporter [unclassified Nocardia]
MRKWLPLLTVCLGTFMLLIDVTIVNVALPDMRNDLDATLSSLQWVVDGYALATAALLLGAGSIADLIGHRRTYLAGLALFAISSLICGLAPNPTVLIVARITQGMGGAAMACTTLALLNSAYPGSDRATAFGLWGAVAGSSTAVGPIIGGILTDLASWRWIFFVNLPVSVVVVVLCLKGGVTQPSRDAGRGRIDLPGMVSFAIFAAAATYGLIHANEYGWSNAVTACSLAIAAVALAVFVAVERRVATPLLELALLRDRSFTGVLLAAGALFLASFSGIMYAQIWLQSTLGMSPIGAGLVGLPLSVVAFLVSGGAGRYLHGEHSGRIICAGLLIAGVGGLLGAALVRGESGWAALVPGSVVVGLGVGLATTTLSSAAVSAVPARQAGMAAGALNTAQQLAMAAGIAILGSAFTTRASTVLAARGVPNADSVAHAVGGGQSGVLLAQAPDAYRPALDTALHTAAAAGVQATLLVSGIVGVVGAGLAAALLRAGRKAAEPVPAPH